MQSVKKVCVEIHKKSIKKSSSKLSARNKVHVVEVDAMLYNIKSNLNEEWEK